MVVCRIDRYYRAHVHLPCPLRPIRISGAVKSFTWSFPMHWNVGLSFDRMREYLSWPADHPYRLAAQTQVIRVVAMVGAKVEDQARRERQGERTVAALVRKLPPEVRFREKP